MLTEELIGLSCLISPLLLCGRAWGFVSVANIAFPQEFVSIDTGRKTTANPSCAIRYILTSY